MTQSNKADPADQAPFVLKHRIVGAAFLIFFGALVLPWLLGPPSEADRATPTAGSSIDAQALSSAQIEDELLDDLAQQSEVEEEVYISKITPLDSQNNALSIAGSQSSSQAEVRSSEKSTEDSAAVAKRAADQRAAEQAADAEAKKQQQAKAAAENAEREAQEKEKRDKAAALAKRQADIEDDLAKALAAEAADVQAVSNGSRVSATPPSSQENMVEIGWAVQVGLFENKTGADRVVQDLRAKGFSPSVTVVDTNRGKATGTRVWLGPFAQRVDAAKEMSRLAERTGQAGFIRAYP